jgi:undecaprenyl-diphosphatase
MFNSFIIFGAQYLIWIIAVIAIIYIAKQKKVKQLKIILLGIIILPVSYIAAKILAHFYYDPRPFVENNFMPLIAHAADNGFPSDHALFGAAIASVVYFFNKKIGIILFILTLLVGLSRVLAGVHHLVDIIGSLVIAITVAALVYEILKRRNFKF